MCKAKDIQQGGHRLLACGSTSALQRLPWTNLCRGMSHSSSRRTPAIKSERDDTLFRSIKTIETSSSSPTVSRSCATCNFRSASSARSCTFSSCINSCTRFSYFSNAAAFYGRQKTENLARYTHFVVWDTRFLPNFRRQVDNRETRLQVSRRSCSLCTRPSVL